MEEITVGGPVKPSEDDDFDEAEYKMNLDKYKKQKAAAEEDAAFPDEVDTPEDIPARTRFQRYRGLKSFRQSPWDAKESLPMDYARIFQFSSFARAQKMALQANPEGFQPGQYVSLVVRGVPRAFAERGLTQEPIICSGLLKHENKMSVVHFKLQRSSWYDKPIKNKSEMSFHVGFRRYTKTPLFSHHQNGCDKHKLERYWHTDGKWIIASVYAPISYQPCSVLACLPQVGAPDMFVGAGSVMSVDPDRIVLKRIVLAGHPFRVHKKSATIRFMFYDPEDITWFKPVELFTKLGHIGNIAESLGTHGYMKCRFNRQLAQHDTVFMALYKRVYPKW